MTVPDLAAGIVARNFEISFLFPETATPEIVRFLEDELRTYQYRSYRILDRYFRLDAEGRTVTARQRSERHGKTETRNLVVPCRADRYLIVPSERAALDDVVLLVEKQRHDWTRRTGTRLGGRHYGSFARISIDIDEMVSLPSRSARRTFPRASVIEFEYAGSGKAEIDRLLAGFRAFCAEASITLAERPRGVDHRMAVLARY